MTPAGRKLTDRPLTSSNPSDDTRRHFLRVADLKHSGGTDFDIRFSPADQADAARNLKIPGVAKMRFQGRVAPLGRTDWELNGTVGATVTQECVLTLAPVKTRIDEEVYRIFRKEVPDFKDGSVIELHIDEHEEPLGAEIDLFSIALEALALALPPYPKAEGAALEKTGFAGEGVAPMTDEDTKPFASLAALKDKLQEE
jgi:uncharacterized metal-binding protein YceD (DUF177 family)